MAFTLKRIAAAMAAAGLAACAFAGSAFAAEALPGQTTFTQNEIAGSSKVSINVLNLKGSPGETVFVTVVRKGAASQVLARYYPHALGNGAETSDGTVTDAFVFDVSSNLVESLLDDGLYVEAFSDRAGSSIGAGEQRVWPVYAITDDGLILIGTHTGEGAFTAPETAADANGVRYVLSASEQATKSGSNLSFAYDKTSDSVGAVDGEIRYYNVASGNQIDYSTPIAAIAKNERREVKVPRTILVGETVYRTISFRDTVTAGNPGQITFNVPCVELTADERADAGYYLATIKMVDSEGAVIATDTANVAGTFTYTAPSAIYKTSTVNGAQTVVGYEKPDQQVWHLDSATDGITSGEREIIVTYQARNEGATQREVTFNLINGQIRADGDAQGRYLGTKTVTVTASSKSAQPDGEIEVDGVTYVIAGKASDYAYTLGKSGTPVVDVYYVPKGYEAEESYDVTVRYVNYANNQVIATDTGTSSPSSHKDMQITTPAKFDERGVTYVRLAGQDKPIAHNYYSNIKTYTVYYRDAKDAASSKTTIEQARVTYQSSQSAARAGNTANAASTAAAGAAGAAAGTTSAGTAGAAASAASAGAPSAGAASADAPSAGAPSAGAADPTAGAANPTADAAASAESADSSTASAPSASAASPSASTDTRANEATSYSVPSGGDANSSLLNPEGRDSSQGRAVNAPSASVTSESETDNGGIPGWAIALALMLSVAAATGLSWFFMFRGRNGEA